MIGGGLCCTRATGFLWVGGGDAFPLTVGLLGLENLQAMAERPSSLALEPRRAEVTVDFLVDDREGRPAVPPRGF